MIRVRSIVPLVAAVASVAFGAVAAGAATVGDGVGSTPPPTDPRPTIPPLTAPSGPATTAPGSGAPPTSVVPDEPSEIPQEPTGHEESDEPDDGDQAVSSEGRAAILAAMGLDEISLECISAAFDPLVTDDAGTVEILQSCEASVAAVARGASDVWVRGQMMFELTPTTAVTGSDEIPIDDAFFVSFMFMVDPDGLECLARDLAASSTDDEALSVLTACDVSIAAIVTGIDMALTAIDPPADTTAPTAPPPGGAPGGTPSTTAAGAVPTAPDPSTTAAAVPSAPDDTEAPVPSGVPLDDPGVPVVQELFADQGIELSAEQAACIVGGLTTVDTDNMASMAALLDACQVF